MKPPLGPELCGSWCVWWESHLSVDSSDSSHTAASSSQHVNPILLISVDLRLPSSLFPFLPPQTETRPWLCPTPTAHLQLFCCQLAAVSSSGCIPSSCSRVRTSGRYQSLVEAAFPGHQPIWSPQWHAGIIPHPCWSWAGALGSFLHTQDISVVPSFSFEDKSTNWSDTSVCWALLPIHWHGWQHCSQFPRGCGFKQLFFSL